MASAPPYVTRWLRQMREINTTGTEDVPAISVDGSNNIYFVYTTNATVSGGANVGATDVIVGKCNSSGVLQWIRQSSVLNTTSSEVFPAIVADSTGNVYISYHTVGTVSGGGNANQNVVLARLDTNGTIQYIRQYVSPFYSSSMNLRSGTIDIDASFVYVAGFTDTAISGGTLLGGTNTADIVLTKYNIADGSISWTRQINGINTLFPESRPQIRVDGSGNIYGIVTYVNVTTVAYVFSVNSAGTARWTKTLENTSLSSSGFGYSIALDGSGNVYVAYTLNGATSSGTFAGTQDVILSRLDPANGNLVWTRQHAQLNTSGTEASPWCDIDASGNLVVAYTTDGTVSGGTASGSTDIVFASVSSSDGSLQRVFQSPLLNSALAETVPRIVMGTDNTVYVVYVTAGTVSGGTLLGSTDIVLAALSPTSVPGAPTGVSATVVAGQTGFNAAQGRVSWTAPTNTGNLSITSYTVTSSPDALTATVSASPATVSGLRGGVAYTFTVVATNAAGNSASSSASSAITPTTVASAPTIGTATAGVQQATVSFTASSNNGGSAITGYTVISTPGNLTASGAASPLTVTGLTAGTAYTFRVRATNGVGNSADSANSNSVTPFTVPGAPTIGTATAGVKQATVTFTPPANDGSSTITGYTVTSTPGGFTASGAASPLTVTGLTAGTAYTFRVTATNAAGTGAQSGASNSVTAYDVPATPVAPTATAGYNQASVAYTAPNNNGATITSYTIRTYLASNNSFVKSTTDTTNPIIVTGLTAGVAYTFTVTATNIAGNSAESAASASVTPTTIPNKPTNVTATAGDTAVTVSWTAPNNGGSPLTGYTITYTPGPGTVTVSNGAATSAQISGLSTRTSYTFTVVATNANGNSDASDVSNVSGLLSTPDAPTGAAVAVVGHGAVVSWTAPVFFGFSPITSYTITAQPGGAQTTVAGTETSFLWTAISNTMEYTFTVTAANAKGSSLASSATATTYATDFMENKSLVIAFRSPASAIATGAPLLSINGTLRSVSDTIAVVLNGGDGTVTLQSLVGVTNSAASTSVTLQASTNYAAVLSFSEGRTTLALFNAAGTALGSSATVSSMSIQSASRVIFGYSESQYSAIWLENIAVYDGNLASERVVQKTLPNLFTTSNTSVGNSYTFGASYGYRYSRVLTTNSPTTTATEIQLDGVQTYATLDFFERAVGRSGSRVQF